MSSHEEQNSCSSNKTKEGNILRTNTSNVTDMKHETPNYGSKEIHGVEDVIHTQIIKDDNPFVEYENSRVEQFGNADGPEGIPNESVSEESEEQLFKREKTTAIEENRRRSSSTSKDSSVDLPFSGVPSADKKVQILEATKMNEGQGRTFIAYAIKFGNLIVKRRYSDFESLRKVLIKLFPMTLIPPIPEKQSFTSYGKAITNSKSAYLLPAESADSVDLSLSVITGPVTKNDEKLIRHRIRMLTSFLNRILKTEEITKTSIIFDFLDPNNKNWNDLITSSPTISSLPKSVLQCNPIDPTNTTMAHAYLPVPSSTSQILTTKDQQNFNDIEEFSKIDAEYKKYEQLLQSGVYKYSRVMTKELNGLKEDFKAISEQFASLSVDQSKEVNGMAELFSHSSDTYDSCSGNLETIVGKLHYNINEPLSECVHMAAAVRELLQYRRLKVVQRDILGRTISQRRMQLKKFKQTEKDASQIDNLVNQQMESSGVVNFRNPNGSETYTGKVMNKFNQIASIIKDSVTSPEQCPASTIQALEKDISQLELSLKVANEDLHVISRTIKDVELPRFIDERNDELTQIFKNYSRYMKENAEKDLKIWKELQKHISQS